MSDITNVSASPNAAVDGKPNKVLNLVIALTAVATVALGIIGIKSFGDFVDQTETERAVKASMNQESCGPLSSKAKANIETALQKAIHRNPKKFFEVLGAEGSETRNNRIYEIFLDRENICAIVKSYER